MMPFRFHNPRPLLVLAVALLVSLVGTRPAISAPREASANASGPNIVFIMADDLGYGHLGCYGQAKIHTPDLDRLATQGMRFTQCYSGSSVCAPSRSVLMTGLHTGHTPIRANGGGMSYDDADLTVGEVLRSAGYATGCFGKWGGGVEDTPGHPNRQGFDEFFGQLHQVHAHFHYPFWVWHNETRYMLPGNENHQRNQYVHDEIHQQALKFIRANHERPFFAYLPYILPHVELVVPEEDELPYRGKFPKLKLPDPRKGYIGSDDAYVTYAGMISRLDRHVGEVLNLLTELGIEDNTLVIFTSDNGAQGGAWDPLLKFFTGAGSLRGHKGQFHEGGIRVPLIARWPSHIQADSTSDHVCAFWDVLPTLAEVAGVTPPADIDGISFLPTLTGKGEQREHESLYWEYPRGGRLDRAIRSGRHKMLVHARRSAIELYDLQADPGETTNVAPQHSELTQKLFEMMKQSHRPEREHPPEVKPPTVADYVR